MITDVRTGGGLEISHGRVTLLVGLVVAAAGALAEVLVDKLWGQV